MATVKLQGTPREGIGKGFARRLRMTGRIPVNLYGHATDSVSMSIDELDLREALSTSSGSRVVIKLEVEGSSKGAVAIVKDLQRHPVTRKIVHVDLLSIDLKVPVDIAVPIRAIGTPEGVRVEGGVLSWGRRELQIRVLPTEIPESIDIDIEDMHVNQALHVGDLEVKGFEILDDAVLTVCSVASTRLDLEEEETEDLEGVEAGAEGEAGAAEGDEAAEPDGE